MGAELRAGRSEGWALEVTIRGLGVGEEGGSSPPPPQPLPGEHVSVTSSARLAQPP